MSKDWLPLSDLNQLIENACTFTWRKESTLYKLCCRRLDMFHFRRVYKYMFLLVLVYLYMYKVIAFEYIFIHPQHKWITSAGGIVEKKIIVLSPVRSLTGILKNGNIGYRLQYTITLQNKQINGDCLLWNLFIIQ